MFGDAARSYVYLCYGIHHLFNIVTNEKEIPHAVLIRAVEPLDGIDVMLRRTGKIKMDNTLTRGPGNVARALGINRLHTGVDLLGETIYLADDGFQIADDDIVSSPRIGVDYAAEDALLLYRFHVKGNPFVTKAKKKS